MSLKKYILLITVYSLYSFNDTHREKLRFTEFSTRMAGWLCFTQLSTGMACWLLLTLLICLQNQLSSIIHIPLSVQMFESCDSSNRHSKWIVAPFSKFYGRIWVGFCLNTEKGCFLEVSFSSQQKEHRFFYKTVLRIFKIALRLRDQHVCMWRSVKILNIFSTL